ncbi:MAG: transposase domain-containing protein [Rhodospirillales bacterium]|nr:transposase domain-containing protein [Rhodospirillales bacterium]
MARTAAALPAGTRITDYISLGVVAKTFPAATVHEILKATGKTGKRQRDLPSHVVVYYVIALALYMNSSCREVLRCLLEGVQWLRGPSSPVKVTGKSGISQARARIGWEPLKRLHDAVVGPIAVPETKGAWYRGRRLVSLDGSTLDIADDPRGVRAPCCQPRQQRPSTDPLRQPGRKRNPCPVRDKDGGVYNQRTRPGRGGLAQSQARHAMSG